MVPSSSLNLFANWLHSSTKALRSSLGGVRLGGGGGGLAFSAWDAWDTWDTWDIRDLGLASAAAVARGCVGSTSLRPPLLSSEQ